MSQKLDGSIPALLDISGDWQIVFRAVDPTTGADISGVVISNIGLAVEPLAGSTAQGLDFGPFTLVPGPGA